ncbi:MAG: hypothetical protein U1E47_00085 [Rivihabitans pingtungensis]
MTANPTPWAALAAARHSTRFPTSIQFTQTLTHWLIDAQRKAGGDSVMLQLLDDIATACKMISHEIAQGAIAAIWARPVARMCKGKSKNSWT